MSDDRTQHEVTRFIWDSMLGHFSPTPDIYGDEIRFTDRDGDEIVITVKVYPKISVMDR